MTFVTGPEGLQQVTALELELTLTPGSVVTLDSDSPY